MRFIKTFGIALVAIGGMAATTPSAQGQSGRADRIAVDTTFFFSKSGLVTLGGGAATVVVNGWDQGTVRVKARAVDGTLRFDASSTRLLIEPARQTDEATITVWVPRGVRVVAHTNSGDIKITDTRGDVDVETSSGDVLVTGARDVDASNLSGDLEVRKPTGSATLASNNGDCTVTDAAGNVEATSVSGDVRVLRSTSKSVHAETTNGDVTFDGSIVADGRYQFASHAGDIWLTVPKTADAQIGITTWSGTVESEFPVTLRPGFSTASTGSGTKRFLLTLGQGSARVTAETFSGDVNISSSGGK